MSQPCGIVSTKPGVLLNGYRSLSTTPSADASTPPIPGGEKREVPVALAGRVPVKVTNENGNVGIGDFLTASKTFPGYAMKATEAGQVLGRALESFYSTDTQINTDSTDTAKGLGNFKSTDTQINTDSTDTAKGLGNFKSTDTQINTDGTDIAKGKILIFIQPTYFQPKVADILQNGQNTDTQVWLTSLTNLNMTNASVFGDIVVTGSVAIQKDLHIGGVVFAGEINTDLLVSKIVKAKEKLCVDDVCVTRDEFRDMVQYFKEQQGSVAGVNTPSPSSEPESNTPPVEVAPVPEALSEPPAPENLSVEVAPDPLPDVAIEP